MLIENLFASGIMTMGPSRHDPNRQVAVLALEALRETPAIRAAELDRFRWIAGEWDFENSVPLTRISPAYTDVGVSRFAISADGAWVCTVAPDGSLQPCITFDPLSRQWIYLLTRGSYGMLRSKEGWVGNQIVFHGTMTMLGVECQWRMTWTKISDTAFGFVNEEQLPDGSWAYIDEWRFQRKRLTDT